ncbi:MAG: HD domain-containing protein [Wujia sp.]
MIYTELTKKALKLCYKAHEGQLDKGGMPYVFHPLHLAEQLDEEYEICVALLHDVVEDTDYTLEDIAREGFPKEIIEAIDCLTRVKPQNYMDYICKVKTNPMAVKIKLLDIEHNSDITRLDDVKQEQRLLEKYKKAKEELLKK